MPAIGSRRTQRMTLGADSAWAAGTPPETSSRLLKAASCAWGEEPASPEEDKAGAGRLRKLTSLRYLRRKVRGWLRPEHRDTIVCEEDEEALGRRNIYDILRQDDRSGVDPFKFVPPSPVQVRHERAEAPPTTSTTSQPSRECRWCLNCSKSFQRRLSKFDNFCGLDCRTAHRFRQAACAKAPPRRGFFPSPQSSCMDAETPRYQ